MDATIKLEIPNHWPDQVQFILSALDAAPGKFDERRQVVRIKHYVQATLRLFSHQPDSPPFDLYVRDVSPRGIGFITPHRLSPSQGGLIQLPDFAGKIISTHGTLLRCRQAAPDWYEGALHFNREQSAFFAPNP